MRTRKKGAKFRERYTVYLPVWSWDVFIVEAESPKDAIRRVMNHEPCEQNCQLVRQKRFTRPHAHRSDER